MLPSVIRCSIRRGLSLCRKPAPSNWPFRYNSAVWRTDKGSYEAMIMRCITQRNLPTRRAVKTIRSVPAHYAEDHGAVKSANSCLSKLALSTGRLLWTKSIESEQKNPLSWVSKFRRTWACAVDSIMARRMLSRIVNKYVQFLNNVLLLFCNAYAYVVQ